MSAGGACGADAPSRSLLHGRRADRPKLVARARCRDFLINAAERGPLPANRELSAPFGALPLADLPLDQSDGSIECGFYIQIGGVKQDGVVRRPHGGIGALRIARVPALDDGQDTPRMSQARRAGATPRSAAGRAPRASAVTKILTSASGQTTVPISRPSSTAPGSWRREIALKIKERGAHGRECAPPPRPPRRRPAAAARVVERTRIDGPRHGGGCRRVLQRRRPRASTSRATAR